MEGEVSIGLKFNICSANLRHLQVHLNRGPISALHLA
jgi:hypothetical protein